MFQTKRVFYRDVHELQADNLSPVGLTLESSFSRPISAQLRDAYTVHMNFVKKLIEASADGDRTAIRATEDLLDGTKTLVEVIKEFNGSTNNSVLLAHSLLKESFLHTTVMFKTAVASCVQATLLKAWDRCSSCFENYVNIETPKTSCDNSGTLELEAIRSGVGHSKPILEGDITHTRWRLGENSTDGYCVALYGDSAEWTYQLENCAKYNLLSAFIDLLTTKHYEQKVLQIIQLYASASGFNANVFDASNTLAGNPAPTVDSINAAINLLNGQTDSSGSPICLNRDYVFVAFNAQICNQIAQLLTTVETRITTGDTLTVVRGNGVYGNVEVCCEDYGRLVATDVSGTSTLPYWQTMWFLFAKPKPGQRNAINFAPYKGFEKPQLFKRRANTESLSGQILSGHGDFDTMVREIKIMSGYGGTVSFPSLIVGSLGDESV